MDLLVQNIKGIKYVCDIGFIVCMCCGIDMGLWFDFMWFLKMWKGGGLIKMLIFVEWEELGCCL